MWQFKVKIEVDNTWVAFNWFELVELISSGVDVSCLRKRFWTGLHDKNGTEIYEGDIVECYDHPTRVANTIGVVEFMHGYYNVNGYALHDYGTAWTEIKGNIYENPELIKTA